MFTIKNIIAVRGIARDYEELGQWTEQISDVCTYHPSQLETIEYIDDENSPIPQDTLTTVITDPQVLQKGEIQCLSPIIIFDVESLYATVITQSPIFHLLKHGHVYYSRPAQSPTKSRSPRGYSLRIEPRYRWSLLLKLSEAIKNAHLQLALSDQLTLIGLHETYNLWAAGLRALTGEAKRDGQHRQEE